MYRLIISCVLGVIIGLLLPNTINIAYAFTIILPLLLFSVGMSLGAIEIQKLLKNCRSHILFPLFSLTGSLIIGILYSVITGQNLKEIALAAGAMGFYSLPAIMVSTQLGAATGTLVLLTNMLREALTIILAPAIVKLFGKQSLIAVGGATTMDVTIGMIKEVAGDSYVPIALINGLVLTLIVPFVISILLYLNF
jgi:uncharacterized membrane protein YbjE (DUF340 family)